MTSSEVKSRMLEQLMLIRTGHQGAVQALKLLVHEYPGVAVEVMSELDKGISKLYDERRSLR